MAWTDERIERLKRLWAEGMSASQIANQLGDVTRNAVIGKIHRLGLSGTRPGRTQRSEAAPRKPRPAPAAPAMVRPVAVQPAVQPVVHRALSVGNTVLKALPEAEPEPVRVGSAEVVALRTAVSLAELGPSSCRWPIGDPAEPGFGFCGHRVAPGGSYCEAHAERAFHARPGRSGRG